jgi:flagellar hook-associated protein 1 FlgK
MSNLLASLSTTAGALNAYDQALLVTQNNVTNAQTPGFAKQTQVLDSVAFDPAAGDQGGVKAGAVQSSRDEYAEQAVRQHTVSLGAAQQNVSSLTSLQSLFDVSGTSGIATTLSNLFQSFSAWGQTPTDPTAQQGVIDSASTLATSFNQAATGLANLSQTTDQQLQQTVSQVNQLAGQLQTDNQQIMQGNQNDAGLDAQVHSTLEQLSQYVNFTATKQSDGTQTVLIDGQTPLVIGGQQYNLSFSLAQPASPPPVNPNGPPHARILSSDGTDITSQTTSGQLGALVNLRNTVLPTYMGDSSQTGDLNTMAKQFADRVNQQLTSGNISDGPPPQPGVPLFTYDSTSNTNIAQSLAVNPDITPSQLAAIAPGPPEVSNGVPLALAQLANPSNAADQINGESYTAFYGGMAARVGSALSDATNQQTVQQSAVAQAQNLRQQTSGVNLDEEAATLVEFQRAYQANSQLITILNQITQDTINILGAVA